MPAAPAHLRAESSGQRVVTTGAVVAALVAACVYLHWRIVISLDGANPILGYALLAADLLVMARFVVMALPALALRVGARVAPPRSVPAVDVVIAVRGESPEALRRAIVAAKEVRGSAGLIVVGDSNRPAVSELCASLGVPHVNHVDFASLGTETHRLAPLLLVVPASVLVSPDVAVVSAQAIADDVEVGAVVGATTIHASVNLIGSRGYGPKIDVDERIAARLDTAGAAPPLDGPVLFRKAALASVGGVPWAEPAAELTAHQLLLRAGWKTRFVHVPVAYRMAPRTEGATLGYRQKRLWAWRSALRAKIPDGSKGNPNAQDKSSKKSRRWAWVGRAMHRLDSLSVFARLIFVFMPAAAALVGALPINVPNRAYAMVVTIAWFGFASFAHHQMAAKETVIFGELRSGMRVIGVDLAATLRPLLRRDPRASRWQTFVLLAALASVIACVGLATRDSDELSSAAWLFLALWAIAVALLVRDATSGYRQLRHLPRVRYSAEGDNDVLEVSPAGYLLCGEGTVGERRETELELLLPGNRTKRLSLPGVVKSSRVTNGVAETFVAVQTGEAAFDDLYYFCAVTAPTIRWLGGSARVRVRTRPATTVSG